MSETALALATSRRRDMLSSASPVTVICFAVIGALVFLAVFGSWIVPQDPHAQNLQLVLAKPSGAHWLGTDLLGRDVFSRILVGARTALLGPTVVALGSFLFGNTLGLLAGYKGGWIEAAIMRWVDVMWALPGLLVIIVVAGALHGGYWLAVALLVVLTTPGDVRIVRAATLEQASRPYVEAAKTVGFSDRRIMFRDIWPNVSALAVANAFLVLTGSIIGLGALSFLGLGVAAGTPDWGLMIAEGTSDLFVNPISVIAPGVMIVLAATSTNLIGDWTYARLASRGATR
jgi:peptide/nickel transport system permease protein